MAERTVVTLGETLAALVEGKKYATLRDILVTMNACLLYTSDAADE